MNLVNELAHIPLLRENGAGGPGPLTLIIHSSQFAQVGNFPGPERISHVLLMDVPAGMSFSVSAPNSLSHVHIAAGLDLLPELAHTQKVFLVPSWLAAALCQAIPTLAREKTWLWGDAQTPGRPPMPDYFQKNKYNLEQACALLADPADKHVFACRIKAIQTGNAGYLPIAAYAEYEHPSIRPLPGDVMLDGGLSDMVSAQKAFAEAVGASGCVHGFEPIQWMAAKAAEQLKPYPQYHVHPAGLADRNGKAEFASLRDSSHMADEEAKGTITCALVSADTFAKNAAIKHVDCIKLDIEGAELAALRGSTGIIARDKPKLIVCMYHKPQDMWEIPLYIHDVAPDYAMHIAHSSCGFTDTILYAATPR